MKRQKEIGSRAHIISIYNIEVIEKRPWMNAKKDIVVLVVSDNAFLILF